MCVHLTANSVPNAGFTSKGLFLCKIKIFCTITSRMSNKDQEAHFVLGAH